MKKQVIDSAKKVLEAFGTPAELFKGKEIKQVMPPFHVSMYIGGKMEWEGLVRIVDAMCSKMYGRPFYKDGYCFMNEKGSVTIFDAGGREYNIDSRVVFQALAVIIYCSMLEIGCFGRTKLSAELFKVQMDAYSSFKFSDTENYVIANILD